MNADLELDVWRNEWFSDEAADRAMLRPELIRLVERKRRDMLLGLAGQLAVGAALLVFSAWFASGRPTPEWILWAAVIWISTLFAATFAVRNNSGAWNALHQSNAAFLELSRRRCFKELSALRLGRWFLAVQLLIVLPWLTVDYATHHLAVGPYLFGVGASSLMAAGYLAWFAARERRALRDLSQLDQLDSEPAS